MVSKTVKLKVTDISHERVRMLERALGLDEQAVLGKAIDQLWEASEPQLRKYLSRINKGNSSLFGDVPTQPAD